MIGHNIPRRFYLLGFVLGMAWLSLSLSLPSTSRAQTERDTLNLVVALDVSGSMSRNISGNNAEINAIDGTVASLFYQGDRSGFFSRSVGTRATDPQGLRFEITRLLLQWLALYAQSQDGLDINATVLTFDQSTSTALPWTALDAGIAVSGLTLTAPNNSGARHADYIDLAVAINDALDDRSGRSAALIITDSAPCDPNDTIVNNITVSDSLCQRRHTPTHIVQMPDLPANVNEYLFFLNPATNQINLDAFWDNYSTLREALNDRYGRQRLMDMESIDELTEQLVPVVLRELAVARGLRLPDDIFNPLSVRDYATLGIAFSNNGAMTVPPYMSHINMLMALPTAAAAINAIDDTGERVTTTPLYDSAESPLQIRQIDRPTPGTYTITATGGQIAIWTLYSPASARLSLQPTIPTQFVPQRLLYQLLDENDEPLPGYAAPIFDIDVQPLGDDEQTANLNAMTYDDDLNGFVSPAFLPLQAGSYAADVNVQPGRSNVWSDVVAYDFLTPPDVRETGFSVVSADFMAVFSVPDRDDAVTASTVTLPRSMVVDVTVTSDVNNRVVALPEGLSLALNFDAAATNACPSDSPMALTPQNDRMQATAQLSFGIAGECDVRVTALLESDLPPLNGGEVDVDVQSATRTLTILPTRRLQFAFLPVNRDTPPEDNNTRPTYSMTERDPTPPEWAYNTLPVRVIFYDEDGEPAWPVYIADSQRPDDHCATPTRTTTSTGTLDNVNVQIPLQLRVLNSNDDDVAPRYGICLEFTDNEGIYRTTIQGLPPDTYTLEAVLNRDNPQLWLDRYEYAPDLFANATQTTAVLTTELVVTVDPLFLVQLYGAIIFVVALVLLILLRIIRWRLRTAAALSGTLAIYQVERRLYNLYRQSGDNVSNAMNFSVDPIWQRSLPNVNHVQYTPEDFIENDDIIRLNISQMVVETRRKRQVAKASGAYIELLTPTGDLTSGKNIHPGERITLDTGDAQWVYVMVKQPPEPDTVYELFNMLQEVN